MHAFNPISHLHMTGYYSFRGSPIDPTDPEVEAMVACLRSNTRQTRQAGDWVFRYYPLGDGSNRVARTVKCLTDRKNYAKGTFKTKRDVQILSINRKGLAKIDSKACLLKNRNKCPDPKKEAFLRKEIEYLQKKELQGAVTPLLGFGTYYSTRLKAPKQYMILKSCIPVDQWIKEGPKTWQQITRVAISALKALQRLHDAGIVHRDIKSENLFIETNPERVVVGDLGLAGEVGTSMNGWIGTIDYCAPEMALASVYNRSLVVCSSLDLFAFARTYYDLLRTHLPACRPTSVIFQEPHYFDVNQFLWGRKDFTGVYFDPRALPECVRESIREAAHPTPSLRPTAGRVADYLEASMKGVVYG